MSFKADTNATYGRLIIVLFANVYIRKQIINVYIRSGVWNIMYNWTTDGTYIIIL